MALASNVADTDLDVAAACAWPVESAGRADRSS
jgi:hypothetical protein